MTADYLLNVGGTLLPLAASLVIVPIYISTIGAARYGILAAVWILLGYFGFLDFGLSRASAIALSRLGRATHVERSPVLVTALYMNAALGMAGGLILFFASGLLIDRYAHLTPDLAAELRTAMPWVALMPPVALVSGVGVGAIESRERFLASNLFQTFGGVVGQVAPVLSALWIAPTLPVMLPAALATRAAFTLLIWLFVLRIERPVNLRSFDRSKVRELLGYGAWITVSSIISPLSQTFDQILIGALLGPAAIAHYSVPINLGTRTQVLSIALTKTLFPRMSQATPEGARLMAARAVVTLSFALSAVCGPAILLADPFLQAWIGRDFAGYAAPVAQILLIVAWANDLGYLPYGMLQSQGRPDLTAKIHSIEIVPFLMLLLVLVQTFGLPGAAAAWTLRTAVDCLIMLRVGGCWTTLLTRALPSLGLILACFAAAQLAGPGLVERLPLAALLFVAAALVFDPHAGARARAALLAAGRFRERRHLHRAAWAAGTAR